MSRQCAVQNKVCTDGECYHGCIKMLPEDRAREDATNFGMGFTRTHLDGRVEHLPPEQVVMFTRPNTQED